MASSPSSTNASAAQDLNPFHAPAPAPVAASMVQLVNIRSHVPEILDLQDSNYSTWSTFFELTFQKFGIMDHVDGTVDAHMRIYDVEWTQIDHCIVSWLHTTLTMDLRTMVFKRRTTTYSLWQSIRGLFLNNAM
jgi:hypothetical protein